MKRLSLIVVVLMLAAGGCVGTLAALVCPHGATTDNHDACCRKSPTPKEAHCAAMPETDMAAVAENDDEHARASAFAPPDFCGHCLKSNTLPTAPVLAAGGGTAEHYQRFLKAATIIIKAPPFARAPKTIQHLDERNAPPSGAVRPHVLLNVFLI